MLVKNGLNLKNPRREPLQLRLLPRLDGGWQPTNDTPPNIAAMELPVLDEINGAIVLPIN